MDLETQYLEEEIDRIFQEVYLKLYMIKTDLCITPKSLSYAQKIDYNAGGWVPKIAREIIPENEFMDIQKEVKYAVNLMHDELFLEAYEDLTSGQIFDTMPTEHLATVAKHYEKLNRINNNGGKYYYNDDFSNLGIRNMDTLVYCRNLEKPYDIYNQGMYLDGSDLYKLIKKGSKESIINTKRIPFANTEIELESTQCKLEKLEDGTANLRVKNEYIGALNRFAIILSTKPPAFHSGCFVILNGAGNKIYVYAIEFNNDIKFEKRLENKVGQWNNATIVIAYGFKKKDLEAKLLQASQYFYKECNGKISILVRPEHEFEEKINWFKELPGDNKEDEGFFDF